MATAPGSPTLTLQVRRTFRAPREKVFAAWTQREQLEQWMCKDVPHQTPTYRRLDVRPGGRYVMEVRDLRKGEVYCGHGVFREVKPPEKLVFTWAWTKGSLDGPSLHPHDPETIVTLEFIARGDATELVLTHSLFATTEVRDMTDRGWNGCFDVLAKVLAGAAC